MPPHLRWESHELIMLMIARSWKTSPGARSFFGPGMRALGESPVFGNFPRKVDADPNHHVLGVVDGVDGKGRVGFLAAGKTVGGGPAIIDGCPPGRGAGGVTAARRPR